MGIRVRLDEFHANVGPVLDFYQEQGEARMATIKIRELADAEKLTEGHSSGHHRPTFLSLDANPEQVFDAIRQHLEGDIYWGTRFRTRLSVKGYECGSSVT